ncbi:MAG: aminotransferase class V-fold PLP-dependent enzyme [Chloroflexi bacterium]|nr:aminotransferase class V-fold PLP-dependent enzyme [Chloroflexota bacterium]
MSDKGQRMIYLDHAATTAVDPRVVEAMLPYWTTQYGNASSIYRLGRQSRQAMEQARRDVADILGAQPEEIVFTGCGSESDNLALRGTAWASRQKGNHIITTPIEHHAISHTLLQLADHFGYEITYVPVDQYGVVNPDDVGRAITDKTVLVTIMYANNEVGTIEPIAEIAKIARAKGVPFHTDAVQAGGSLDLNVERLGVDLLSLSAHKFYGPKGIGLLYVRRGTPLLPTNTGGGQEMGLRAGTENVAYMVGLATALKLAYAHLEENNRRIALLRDQLIRGVLSSVQYAHLTGHSTQRLSNNASFVFDYIEGESILLGLDAQGVAASSGSACSTGEAEPSHVLTAMGIPPRRAYGSLRLSLGNENTAQDVQDVVAMLPGIVHKLQQMSPLCPGATALA